MADTSVQLLVERWVCQHWLPSQFNQAFGPQKLTLSAGGVFEFDAVSSDGRIVASISTSSALTASGNLGTGKLMKIRSDMYFLLLTEGVKRYLVFTEKSMVDLCEKERQKGRVPDSIGFLWAQIPNDLNAMLQVAKAASSKEVTPVN